MEITLKELLFQWRQCPVCGNRTYLVSRDDDHELACEKCSWRRKADPIP